MSIQNYQIKIQGYLHGKRLRSAGRELSPRNFHFGKAL